MSGGLVLEPKDRMGVWRGRAEMLIISELHGELGLKLSELGLLVVLLCLRCDPCDENQVNIQLHNVGSVKQLTFSSRRYADR